MIDQYRITPKFRDMPVSSQEGALRELAAQIGEMVAAIVFQRPQHDVPDTHNLAAMHLDSMDKIILLTEIQARYNVEIDIEETGVDILSDIAALAAKVFELQIERDLL